MPVNEKECEVAGVDPTVVKGLLRRCEALGRDCAKYGITIFGGSGSGDLRFDEHSADGALILAPIINGHWDGGDGSYIEDSQGLIRGETA